MEDGRKPSLFKTSVESSEEKSAEIVVSADAIEGDYEESSVYIVVDARERNGALDIIKPFLEVDNIANSTKSGNGGKIGYMVKQVTVGDYIIVKNGVVSAIFERKTWKDMAASIKDGRIYTQHERMCEIEANSGVRIFYIVEGAIGNDDDKVTARMPFKALNTKVRHLTLLGTQIIHTLNTNDTARHVVKYARDIAISNEYCGIAYFRKQMAVMAQQCRHYGYGTLAGYIDNAMDDKTIMGGVSADISSAVKVLTTRQETPEEVILCNMWKAFAYITDANVNFIRSKMKLMDFVLCSEDYADVFANLTYASGTRLGKRSVKIIEDLNREEVVAKLVSAVPGFSAKAAKNVAAYYGNIKRLIATSVEELVTVRKTEKSNINKKLATTLLDLLQRA